MNMNALSLFADPYPQRRHWQRPGWLDRLAQNLVTGWRARFSGSNWPARVQQAQQSWLDLPAQERDQSAQDLVRSMRRKGLSNDGELARAMAWVSLQAKDALGMSAYPHQWHTACLLMRGYLVELDTGEGKSLAAALAAACSAWAGIPVHVISVNDYLVERDAAAFTPLYRALGLRCAVILESTPANERSLQYASDIVYLSNKTAAFDYLRDRARMQDRLDPLRLGLQSWLSTNKSATMRGLAMAIVDEADSVFIDEARTPLILSRTVPQPQLNAFYRQAMECAKSLVRDLHYRWDGARRQVNWLSAGLTHLEIWSNRPNFSPLWRARLRREEAVMQALSALHRHERDVHYIVRDDKVLIVDENTGRVMPDRSWEAGLHQMVEIKEGVAITDERETIARISYQQFLPRYLSLSGMTGTCREVASEVGQVYRLPVVRVNPRLPSRRELRLRRVHSHSSQRWQAVAQAVIDCVERQQPVLVGLRTIQACDHLGTILRSMGVAHQVLHARQDAHEAELVAQAGRSGSVTLATNMGGRGTDIRLSDQSRQSGGLHVILTELHDSRRIDRQLIGRCARQGDPGSWEVHISLEDELFDGFLGAVQSRLMLGLQRWPQSRFIQALAWRYARLAQRSVEWGHRQVRLVLQTSDDQVRRSLAFTGVLE